jgi:hypothetical protein
VGSEHLVGNAAGGMTDPLVGEVHLAAEIDDSLQVDYQRNSSSQSATN